jgi:hypothetical protein
VEEAMGNLKERLERGSCNYETIRKLKQDRVKEVANRVPDVEALHKQQQDQQYNTWE